MLKYEGATARELDDFLEEAIEKGGLTKEQARDLRDRREW
jgi:hypothetical protein